MRTLARTNLGFLTALRFVVPVTALALASSRVTGASDTNWVFLADQHVDIRIDYQEGRTNPLAILVADEDSGRQLESTNVVLVGSEAARVILPSDLPPFGDEGNALWLLPQTQQNGVLFLGFSAERNPAGVFAGPLDFRLLELDGPGQFFLWQAEVGDLQILINTRDGIGFEDHFTQLLGGHSHLNWGFTSNGVYRLTFQASGQRLGETTNLLSLPTVITFHVLPLPPSLETPYQKWQAAQWPGITDPTVVGPTADPDSDGQVNLVEFATARDPKSADSEPSLGVDRVVTAGLPFPTVSYRRSKIATDTVLTLESAHSVSGPWRERDGPRQGADHGEFETITVGLSEDEVAIPAQFFRLRVAFRSSPSLAFPSDLAPMTP